MTSVVPLLVGICPGAHTAHFYVPLDPPGRDVICPECDETMVVYAHREAVASAVVAGVEVAGKVRDANRAERYRLHDSRALWTRSFNRLEKAVTNHIAGCLDADELAHVHRAVMRDLGPKGEEHSR